MTTRTLSCKDLGYPACDYLAGGESGEAMKQSMREHAEKTHSLEVKTPEQEAALEEKMAAALGEDPVAGLGAHGRFGVEEEKGEVGSPRKVKRNPVARDPSEPRRVAARDRHIRESGEDRT